MAESRLEKAVEVAQLAFWAEIAKHYPEVQYGDFGPEETFAFDNACETAVRTWLRWNMHISPREGSKCALTQPVEKYPHFKAMPGMLGTIMEADADIVRLRMDVTLPGAEEWDNEIVWTPDDDPEGISALNAFFKDAELVSCTVATHTLGEKESVELSIPGGPGAARCRISVTHLTDGDGGHFVKLGGVNCDLDGEMPGEYYLKHKPSEALLPAQMTVVMSFKPDAGTADLDRRLMAAGIDGLLGVDAVFPGDIASPEED